MTGNEQLETLLSTFIAQRASIIEILNNQHKLLESLVGGQKQPLTSNIVYTSKTNGQMMNRSQILASFIQDQTLHSVYNAVVPL